MSSDIAKGVIEKLKEENVALQQDKERLEYLFWPSGSRKARYWLGKFIESGHYCDASKIEIWRTAIDAARKQPQQ